MANNLIQCRIDEASKIKAEIICNKLGIDLQTYIRICVAKLISKNGIPFDMIADDESGKDMKAILEANRISEENGNSEMTLDEINEEIRLAREERDAKSKGYDVEDALKELKK